MKKIIWITSIIATIVILASYTISERHQLSEMTIKKDMPVQQVLQQLGDEQPNHVLNKSLNKTSAAIGEALFKKGLAKKEG
jgi:hypothetical protein